MSNLKYGGAQSRNIVRVTRLARSGSSRWRADRIDWIIENKYQREVSLEMIVNEIKFEGLSAMNSESFPDERQGRPILLAHEDRFNTAP